jgi:DNA-3-methyladenine glycosylase II
MRRAMNFVVSPEGPLDVGATLSRYRIWGEDPVNRVGDGVFRRVLRLDEALHAYEVRWDGAVDSPRLSISVPTSRSARVRDAVALEVRRIFGLDFDLPGFYRMAKADPALADLVSSLYGLRPTLAPGGLEMLVGSITAQQVNLTFAFALRARLVRRYGVPVSIGGETVYAFPEARVLAGLPVATLRAMQFSTRKAEYIRDVARAIAAGGLDLAALAEAPSDDVIACLTALRGLGRWTADWYLARCLGRGDVCPAGDLAVRKVFDHHYGRGRTLSEAAIRRRAGAWGQYQSLAIHYLLVGMRLARPAAGGGTA